MDVNFKPPKHALEVVVLALLLTSLFGSALLNSAVSGQGVIRRVTSEGPAVPFARPVPVDHSFPSVGLEIGFADSEADGTWITSSLASLRFQVTGESAPRNLSLAVFPFTSEAFPTREISVVTSKGTSSFTLSSGGQIIQVNLDGSARQLVSIRCHLIGSPVDLGLGDDVRDLCVKLMWFEVA